MFCSLFSSIAMAWCIMNFCHQGVRSIRNTTLKLCADYMKQFVRNPQNCEKTNHWILHHDNAPAHTTMLGRKFLAKNKIVIMPQPPYSPHLVPASFLPTQKTPMKGIRFAKIEEIKEKSKQELLAIPKCSFRKCMISVGITLKRIR